MNTNFILLFAGLSLFNVIMQTVKSLCTIKSSTFVSACVNALAYGVYVYVIVFTNSEGLPLWGKALITAGANFIGVYIANFMFQKIFSGEVAWVVSASIPQEKYNTFKEGLLEYEIPFHCYGYNSDKEFILTDIYCATKEDSKALKRLLPHNAMYNISENRKRL